MRLWGTLWVSPAYKPGKSTKLSRQVWTPQNWDAFLGRLDEVPAKAWVSLGRLASNGFPGSEHWAASVVRDVDAPDFGTLTVRASSREFTDPATSRDVQRRWLDFLDRRLRADPEILFGSLADDGEDADRTELEVALGLFPDDTLPGLDSVLRGYSWVTVCSMRRDAPTGRRRVPRRITRVRPCCPPERRRGAAPGDRRHQGVRPGPRRGRLRPAAPRTPTRHAEPRLHGPRSQDRLRGALTRVPAPVRQDSAALREERREPDQP